MTGRSSSSGEATLLGPPGLRGPKGVEVPVTRPQVQLVLTRLLWDGQPTSVDALADLIWGDAPLADHWRGAIRGVVSKVRAAFVAAGIEADVGIAGDGRVTATVPAGFEVDVQQARRAIRSAEAAIEVGCPEEASSLLKGWVDRLLQPLLPASDGAWAREAAEEVEGLARRALTLQASAALASGRPLGAERDLRSWIAVHPLDETVHHRLIEVLVAAGRRTDARAVLDRLRGMLDRELGVGPAAATIRLLGEVEAVGSTGSRPTRSAGFHEHTATERRSTSSSSAPPEPLLGRTAETVALRAAWESVQARGRPHLMLLKGPSGIGKTRLALELRSAVAADGHQTMLCRCLPGASLPFEPLASTVIGGDGPEAVQEMRRALSSPSGGPTEPGVARARLFDLITTSMQHRGGEPGLLVVDDLQWIDADGLDLLEHLVTTSATPLLVVATGRELPDAVHETMARLARRLTVNSKALGGLSADDLVPLFPQVPTDEATDAARALHRHTGGHPFFIAEIVEAAKRTGSKVDVFAVPDAVREWISHRIDALPRHIRARLNLAAVIGPGTRAADLAACARMPIEVVLDDLDALVELGLLVEDDEAGHFSLPHQIVGDVVYERLGPSRQARLHLAVAEGLSVSDPGGNPAVVADHFLAAGPEHIDKAARLLSKAADHAYEQGAWALATERQRMVLDVVADRPAERAVALVGLARSLHLQGDRLQAETCLVEALDVARLQRLPLVLADAALVLVGRAGRGAGRHDDAEQIELLEEALAALERAVALDPSPIDPAEARRRDSLHCQIEVELAIALSLWAPLERRTDLAMAALERAQEVRPLDQELHAMTLLGAHTVRFGPDEIQDRLDAEAEVLAIPVGSRSLDTTLTALIYRHESLLRVGRREEARRHLEAAVGLSEDHAHPYWGWAAATWTALDALIDGDLEDAEQMATAAAQRPNTDQSGALACFGVNLVNIRLYQGRSGEMLDLLAGAADANPEIPCYRAVLSLCAERAGDRRLAEAAYEPFRRSRFEMVPHDTNRLLTLAVLADVAVAIGDADAAPDLWALLEPYRGQHALLNCYGGGGSYWGPVAGPLAGLASLIGRPDHAASLLEQARQSAADVASPLALAYLDDRGPITS